MPTTDFSAVSAFPFRGDRSTRLAFQAPTEVVIAETLEEVRPALDRVDALSRAGKWAVGFVAYDAAPAFDSALAVPPRDGPSVPLLCFGIFDAASEIVNRHVLPGVQELAWTPHVAHALYASTVEQIRQGIRDGDFYQVNHTLRLRGTLDPAAIREMFETMRDAQPESYAMLLRADRWEILSVSPELFFERKGSAITTRPMKGTIARGRWSDEDLTQRELLAESEKDRAENVMIVDLVRNDLGRVAKTGTVEVPKLFEIEEHPTVWQMTSTITATLRDDVSLTKIFAALFPCGSVVGAPKIAAAKFIAANELAPRGVYCGAIGVIEPGGDCVFNVAIRTLVIDRETGTAEYGVGGGITIDSTASGEYDELRAKAEILRGMPSDIGLIETLRLSDGVLVRRERHVRRIVESAKYFGYGDVSALVRELLDAQVNETPTGDHRVRLVISPTGESRIEAKPIARRSTQQLPIRCAIAPTPVSSRDRLLFHKTTNRRVYDERQAEHPDVDDVILVNERGELTECTIGNIVVELHGTRYTPPLDCGLLPGIFREELLERGEIVERVLHPSDLSAARQIWRISSLREWVEIELTR